MSEKRSFTGRRTITWVAPGVDEKDFGTISGLELLGAVRDGRTPPPPVWRLIGLRLVEINEGHAAFEIQFGEYHYGRFGKVHGGMQCAALDTAMGYAVHSTLPAGVAYTTVELKVNYLRPITMESGLMQCVGRVIHRGSRIAVAEASMLDCHGVLYAHAISTCLILQNKTDKKDRPKGRKGV